MLFKVNLITVHVQKIPSKLVIDELLKMVGYSCWTITSNAAIYLKDPLAELVERSSLQGKISGETFCLFVQAFATVGILHGFVGGVGIALVRLLYIRYPTKLPLRISALVITAISLSITAVGSYYFVVIPTPSQNLASVCQGRPKAFDEILFHASSSDNSNRSWPLLALVGIILVLSELAMYTSICVYLVQHNRMMTLVLASDTIKERNRKNVIDLMGHMINFAFENYILVFMYLGTYWIANNRRFIYRCISVSSYGILGAFHISFSPLLRRDFIETMNNILLFLWNMLNFVSLLFGRLKIQGGMTISPGAMT